MNRIPPQIVREAQRLGKAGWTHRQIAEKLRISKSAVGRAVKAPPVFCKPIEQPAPTRKPAPQAAQSPQVTNDRRLDEIEAAEHSASLRAETVLAHIAEDNAECRRFLDGNPSDVFDALISSGELGGLSALHSASHLADVALVVADVVPSDEVADRQRAIRSARSRRRVSPRRQGDAVTAAAPPRSMLDEPPPSLADSYFWLIANAAPGATTSGAHREYVVDAAIFMLEVQRREGIEARA